MPNSLSAKKRLRQNERLQLRNRSMKRSVKTQLKRVHTAIAEGDYAKGDEEFRTAVKRLDQAAAKRVIHPNAAARTKSRLSAKLKAAKQGK
ncbi:MAG: 30S ribosomal protein S20 [Pirellulales bacterium]|nr:30S ribosomal protein S20 [Pirellulales bacterium]